MLKCYLHMNQRVNLLSVAVLDVRHTWKGFTDHFWLFFLSWFFERLKCISIHTRWNFFLANIKIEFKLRGRVGWGRGAHSHYLPFGLWRDFWPITIILEKNPNYSNIYPSFSCCRQSFQICSLTFSSDWDPNWSQTIEFSRRHKI